MLGNFATNHAPDDVFSFPQMYHEACAVTLLETITYHGRACELLDGVVADLIDYCHRQLACVANDEDQVGALMRADGNVKHLDVGRLSFKIAAACASVLRFLSGHVDRSVFFLAKSAPVCNVFEFLVLLVAGWERGSLLECLFQWTSLSWLQGSSDRSPGS